MARYSAGTGMGGTPQAMTTTYKTLVQITSAGSNRRGAIYHFMVGADGAPADNTLVHKLDRQTTVGTGTTITAQPLDGDAAASLVSTANMTAEGTVTDNTELVEIPCNQRGSFQWMAGQRGELIVPGTANNGIGLRTKSSAYTGTMVAVIHFAE